MMGMPRIQGRVGQVEDPPELKGKYTFELILSIIGREDSHTWQCGEYWNTEAEAKENLMIAVRKATEAIETQISGQPPSGKYFDLLSRELRPWENQ